MSNIDNHEVDKFNDLASRWWDLDGECKPLHDMNPLRLHYIMEHAGGLKNKAVIDVGCGGGILSESLAKSGANVSAIDLAKDALDVAKIHAEHAQLSVNYQLSTVEDYAQLNPAQFDVVCCLEMLEHVPDPESVVSACAALLKPNGIAFFSTINRSAKAYVMAIIGAEHVLRLLPRGTHDYKKFIRPGELDYWARRNRLDLKHITGMHYNPISQHFSLSAGTDVNYISSFTKV